MNNDAHIHSEVMLLQGANSHKKQELNQRHLQSLMGRVWQVPGPHTLHGSRQRAAEAGAWTPHLAQQPSACGRGRCLGTGVSLPTRCPQHCVLSVTVCVVSESRIGLVCVVWCLGYENG